VLYNLRFRVPVSSHKINMQWEGRIFPSLCIMFETGCELFQEVFYVLYVRVHVCGARGALKLPDVYTVGSCLLIPPSVHIPPYY
jgi:hypothetical protein